MGRPRTWTDDDLRDAVARSTTMAAVVQRLRLARGGASYVTVRSRMEHLGLTLASTSVAHRAEGNRRRWSEEDLRQAVTAATSLHQVFTRLGLKVGGSQWLVIRSLIIERGWSTRHWRRPLEPPAAPVAPAFREALAVADLDALLLTCRSRADLIRSLGATPTSTTYRLLREALTDRDLDRASFEEPHAAMQRAPRCRYRTALGDILVENSTYTNLSTLKARLIDAGLLEPVCAVCRLDSWCERPLTLHLDHINGIRNDHRLENIRLLCPNCHSQTDTFCGRNIGNRYSSGPGSG